MPAESVRLVCGPAPWLTLLHAAVSLTAALALLALAQQTPWTVGALTALALVHGLGARRMRRTAREAPRIRLWPDGQGAILQPAGAEPAERCGGGFMSPWFLVVPLRSLASGRVLHCLAMRSRNSDDEFRRARVLLRHGAQAQAFPRSADA